MENFSKKPDYSHIAEDAEITINITAEEAEAVFWAYDRGIDSLDEEAKGRLNAVMSKIKFELWP